MHRDPERPERQGAAEQRSRSGNAHRRRAGQRAHQDHEIGTADDALRRAMDVLTAEARYAVAQAERTIKTRSR